MQLSVEYRVLSTVVVYWSGTVSQTTQPRRIHLLLYYTTGNTTNLGLRDCEQFLMQYKEEMEKEVADNLRELERLPS